MQNKKITLLGAGLVGSLLALLLKQKGHEVTLYERRPDMRKEKLSAGRSINLALSHRGWKALKMAGIDKEIEKIALPMYARCIHDDDGSVNIQKYGKSNEAIYSVSRGDLNMALMNAAEEAGVKLIFDYKSKRIDVDKNIITFEHEGENLKEEADLIIGSDGAFSSLRTAYTMMDRTDYQQMYLKHGYKELHIDDDNGKWKIANDCLHIWPRKNFMLIALPNMDGSFTVTLFLPFEGEPSFQSLSTDEKIATFFQKEFPDAVPILHDLIPTFHKNPTSSLITVKTEPWGFQDKSFIIGDAAHAIVPFYGQGMNAGFEDCSVLMELMEEHDDWGNLIQAYDKSRKPNGDAIADLAIRNFIEMRDWVSEPEFLERKKIEKDLGRMYPDSFNSVYEMVSFTSTDYAYALKCTKLQDELLKSIMKMGEWDKIKDQPESRAKVDKLMLTYQQETQS